jgi:hypothetical protein
MVILVFCPFCKQEVTAATILKDFEVRSALNKQHHVEVIHTLSKPHTLGEDHRWKLSAEEKKNLRNTPDR